MVCGPREWCVPECVDQLRGLVVEPLALGLAHAWLLAVPGALVGAGGEIQLGAGVVNEVAGGLELLLIDRAASGDRRLVRVELSVECREPGSCEARESADRSGAHSVSVRIGGADLTVGGGVSQREGQTGRDLGIRAEVADNLLQQSASLRRSLPDPAFDQ